MRGLVRHARRRHGSTATTAARHLSAFFSGEWPWRFDVDRCLLCSTRDKGCKVICNGSCLGLRRTSRRLLGSPLHYCACLCASCGRRDPSCSRGANFFLVVSDRLSSSSERLLLVVYRLVGYFYYSSFRKSCPRGTCYTITGDRGK